MCVCLSCVGCWVLWRRWQRFWRQPVTTWTTLESTRHFWHPLTTHLLRSTRSVYNQMTDVRHSRHVSSLTDDGIAVRTLFYHVAAPQHSLLYTLRCYRYRHDVPLSVWHALVLVNKRLKVKRYSCPVRNKIASELRVVTVVTCHIRSYSIICFPTQVIIPRLNPSQSGRYSIYLPRRTEGWVGIGDWLHTEMVYLRIQTITGTQVHTLHVHVGISAHDRELNFCPASMHQPPPVPDL